MPLIRFFLLVLTLALASCGGGGDDSGTPPPPPAETVTFAFRLQNAGPVQEFRYATASPAFIAKARAQLLLPVVGRHQFPIGPIAAGSGGVNLNWNWHFTSLDFAEAAIALCDGTPAMVEADLSYWINTVKSFCPWSGYLHSEVAGSYTLRRMAIGDVREIAQEDMRIELKDVTDSRCPAAAICITAGFATAHLVVRIGNRAPEALTVTLDHAAGDKQTVFAGYRFTLDQLDPFPISGPAPKDQFRADITVQKL